MTVAKRKNRMISFRLSDEEYEHLVNLCETQSARSLSDLARSAMQNLIANGGVNGGGDGIEERLTHLDGRVSALDQAVERLARLVSDDGGPGK
ncbi:MAG: hypothetical protein LLG20_00725 [Acidobacteriales bacterium]|nr:hypothetical protein [Terriglobales bacterium]